MLGLFKSYILHVLHIPAMSLSFVSEISIRLGMRLNCASFIYSFWELVPVRGSQNFIVPSYDPLANFNISMDGSILNLL